MRFSRLATVRTVYIFVLASILTPGLAPAQPRRAKPSAPNVEQTLALQVALDRAGFSPGEIDGRGGPKTRMALAEAQRALGQPVVPVDQPLVSYTITEQDVAGPFIEKMPRDMMESATLKALGYTSVLEKLAEKFHSSPSLLRALNPKAGWNAAEEIQVPAVEPFELPGSTPKPARSGQPAARGTSGVKPGAESNAGPSGVDVIVSGSTRSLTVRDGAGKVVMFAPITVGSEKDPLPVGEWKVLSVSWNPVFNYNPDLFWDADPAHAKAKIPAGPNNPVGIVWIDINKEHFGLHGTPEPSTIGRTESHGCIRLTNWDAARLGQLVTVGTKVTIQ